MAQQTGPEYIAYCRSLKFSDAEIRAAMQQAGWQEADLQTAFRQAVSPLPRRSGRGLKTLWIILAVIIFLLLGLVGAVAFMLLCA